MRVLFLCVCKNMINSMSHSNPPLFPCHLCPDSFYLSVSLFLPDFSRICVQKGKGKTSESWGNALRMKIYGYIHPWWQSANTYWVSSWVNLPNSWGYRLKEEESLSWGEVSHIYSFHTVWSRIRLLIYDGLKMYS